MQSINFKKNLLIIMLLVFGFIAKSQVLLQSDFQNPSSQYQPRVWWRWIGGNVSKEGITKDLEEISAKGMNEMPTIK